MIYGTQNNSNELNGPSMLPHRDAVMMETVFGEPILATLTNEPGDHANPYFKVSDLEKKLGSTPSSVLRLKFLEGEKHNRIILYTLGGGSSWHLGFGRPNGYVVTLSLTCEFVASDEFSIFRTTLLHKLVHDMSNNVPTTRVRVACWEWDEMIKTDFWEQITLLKKMNEL